MCIEFSKPFPPVHRELILSLLDNLIYIIIVTFNMYIRDTISVY